MIDNNPDLIEQRRRWQEMCADLGLDPDEPEPAAKEPVVHTPPPPVHQPKQIEEYPAILEPEFREYPSDPIAHAPKAEELPSKPVVVAMIDEVIIEKTITVERVVEPAPRGRGRRGDSESRRRSAPPPVVEEAPAAEMLDVELPIAEGPVVETPPREERPSRRRRGRRSAKPSAEAPESIAEVVEPEPGPEAVTAEDGPAVDAGEEEKPSRRRRTRGRSRKPVVAEAPVRDDDAVETEDVPVPSAAEEIADEDRLDDWNVPSWNDLIASLYRPER